MAKLLESWGIKPAAMIGHSAGEYAAACLAGVVSHARTGWRSSRCAAGCSRRCRRGHAQRAAVRGRAARAACPRALSIAAINAADLCVASGPVALDRGAGGDARRPRRRHAPASTSTSPPTRRCSSRSSPSSAPSAGRSRSTRRPIPYVSNLTGTWITRRRRHRPRLLGPPPAQHGALPRRHRHDPRRHQPRAARGRARAARSASLARHGAGTAGGRLADAAPPEGGGVRRRLRPRRRRPGVGGRASSSIRRRCSPTRSAAACRCRPIRSSASATGSSPTPPTRRASVGEGRAAQAARRRRLVLHAVVAPLDRRRRSPSGPVPLVRRDHRRRPPAGRRPRRPPRRQPPRRLGRARRSLPAPSRRPLRGQPGHAPTTGSALSRRSPPTACCPAPSSTPPPSGRRAVAAASGWPPTTTSSPTARRSRATTPACCSSPGPCRRSREPVRLALVTSGVHALDSTDPLLPERALLHGDVPGDPPRARQRRHAWRSTSISRRPGAAAAAALVAAARGRARRRVGRPTSSCCARGERWVRTLRTGARCRRPSTSPWQPRRRPPDHRRLRRHRPVDRPAHRQELGVARRSCSSAAARCRPRTSGTRPCAPSTPIRGCASGSTPSCSCARSGPRSSSLAADVTDEAAVHRGRRRRATPVTAAISTA